MLTDTSGLDPSRLVVTVDDGWMGYEIKLDDTLIPLGNWDCSLN